MSDFSGTRGVIFGVATERSIAWGIAEELASRGAELVFACEEGARKHVEKLVSRIGMSRIHTFDAAKSGDILRVCGEIIGEDSYNFVVHSIAYTDPKELAGPYSHVSEENFIKTMLVTCFSLGQVAQGMAPRMAAESSILTLSYIGAELVMPNYHVIGAAKAALEQSVRLLAVEYGPANIRFNALSPNVLKTPSGSRVPERMLIHDFEEAMSPSGELADIDSVAHEAASVLHRRSRVNGRILHVDNGASVTRIPPSSNKAKVEGAVARMRPSQDNISIAGAVKPGFA